VKSIQGSLSVVNPEHVVLAALSSKDTVTIPSVTADSPSKVMVAQAGQTGGGSSSSSSGGEFLGLDTGTWLWIGAGAVVLGGVGGGIAIYENNTGHHHHYYELVCP
jgi:hypothetical protein